VDGGGNFDSNPMFITPINPSKAPTTKGNLRLESESPAVDSGDNAFVIDIPSDLDSAPRIIDGDMDGTPKVDMGAYEYQIPYIYNEYIPFIIR
jgi:hypothetical protein